MVFEKVSGKHKSTFRRTGVAASYLELLGALFELVFERQHQSLGRLQLHRQVCGIHPSTSARRGAWSGRGFEVVVGLFERLQLAFHSLVVFAEPLALFFDRLDLVELVLREFGCLEVGDA